MATLSEEDLLDPHPDIHGLFVHYNALYFENALGGVSVEWSSSRMTSCGGTCQRVPGGAVIKLSRPLLLLRPATDLKMVLLHEMIHAYCMVQRIQDDDPGGHGTAFKTIMQGINASTVPDLQRPLGGYKITVCHSMFAEVDYYRKHQWKCARCGDEIKRAMNRKPQEADCRWRAGAGCTDKTCRWHMHVKFCGGEYIKIKGPEGFAEKKAGKGAKRKLPLEIRTESTSTGVVPPPGNRPISDWFNPIEVSRNLSFEQVASREDSFNDKDVCPAVAVVLPTGQAPGTESKGSGGRLEKNDGVEPESMKERRRIFEAAALRRMHDASRSSTVAIQIESKPKTEQMDGGVVVDLVSPIADKAMKITCPVCGVSVSDDNAQLNTHLDECLGGVP